MAKQTEKERSECKACKKPYIALLTHLNQANCMEKYTEDEIATIKSENDKKKKLYQKNYHEKNQKSKTQRQKQLRNERKEETNEKQQAYRYGNQG